MKITRKYIKQLINEVQYDWLTDLEDFEDMETSLLSNMQRSIDTDYKKYKSKVSKQFNNPPQFENFVKNIMDNKVVKDNWYQVKTKNKYDDIYRIKSNKTGYVTISKYNLTTDINTLGEEFKTFSNSNSVGSKSEFDILDVIKY